MKVLWGCFLFLIFCHCNLEETKDSFWMEAYRTGHLDLALVLLEELRENRDLNEEEILTLGKLYFFLRKPSKLRELMDSIPNPSFELVLVHARSLLAHGYSSAEKKALKPKLESLISLSPEALVLYLKLFPGKENPEIQAQAEYFRTLLKQIPIKGE